MKWFGQDWGAPICKDAERVAIPEGEMCHYCGKPIAPFHTGVVMPFSKGKGDPPEVPAHLRCFWEALGIGKHAGTA